MFPQLFTYRIKVLEDLGDSFALAGSCGSKDQGHGHEGQRAKKLRIQRWIEQEFARIARML